MINPYIAPGLRDTCFTMDAEKKARKIINAVCEFYNEDTSFVSRKSRKKEIVKARQICMYLIKKQTSLKLKNIGELFDHEYDHTTVIHAVNTVKDQLSLPFDNDMKQDYKEIIARL